MSDLPETNIPSDEAELVYEMLGMILDRPDLLDCDAHTFALAATRDKPGVNIGVSDRTVTDARWVAFERTLDDLGWPYQFTAWQSGKATWTVSYSYAADEEWFSEYMFGFEKMSHVERLGAFYGYDERDVEYFAQCEGMPANIVRKWTVDNFDAFDVTLDDLAHLEFIYNVIKPTEERLYEAIETGKQRYQRLLAVADDADSDAFRDSVETYLEHERDQWEQALAYDDETWDRLL